MAKKKRSAAVPLTPPQMQAIRAYVQAGAFPETAFAAEGIRMETLSDWRDQVGAGTADVALRKFLEEVEVAHGRCRVLLEIKIKDEKPLDWLKYGPGRATPDRPGWASIAAADSYRPAMQTPAVFSMVSTALMAAVTALPNDPEIRAKFADTVGQQIAAIQKLGIARFQRNLQAGRPADSEVDDDEPINVMPAPDAELEPGWPP